MLSLQIDVRRDNTRAHLVHSMFMVKWQTRAGNPHLNKVSRQVPHRLNTWNP